MRCLRGSIVCFVYSCSDTSTNRSAKYGCSSPKSFSTHNIFCCGLFLVSLYLLPKINSRVGTKKFGLTAFKHIHLRYIYSQYFSSLSRYLPNQVDIVNPIANADSAETIVLSALTPISKRQKFKQKPKNKNILFLLKLLFSFQVCFL